MATRKVTNKLIEMMEEGALEAETLAKACLIYMSERDVADMAADNEFLVDDDVYEEEDEEDELEAGELESYSDERDY